VDLTDMTDQFWTASSMYPLGEPCTELV